jgi:hypothetical protein
MELHSSSTEYSKMDGSGIEGRRNSVSTRHLAALLSLSLVAIGLSIASLSVSLATAHRVTADPRLTVAQRINGYFNNLDLRQWDSAMDFFEETYFSDYDIEGATPMTLNRDTNWLVWPCFLEGFNTTHHQLGNTVVDFAGVNPTTDGAVAHVTSKVTATHNYNGSLWKTAGIYDMELRRYSEGPYRLFTIKYRQHWATGDETTLSQLALTAAWDKNSAFCSAHGGTKPNFTQAN